MIRNTEKSEEYDAGREPILVSFGKLFFKKRKGCWKFAINLQLVKFVVKCSLPSNISSNRVRFSFPREDPSHERKRVRVGLNRAGRTSPDQSWGAEYDAGHKLTSFLVNATF
jgi:hypothetical protein